MGVEQSSHPKLLEELLRPCSSTAKSRVKTLISRFLAVILGHNEVNMLYLRGLGKSGPPKTLCVYINKHFDQFWCVWMIIVLRKCYYSFILTVLLNVTCNTLQLQNAPYWSWPFTPGMWTVEACVNPPGNMFNISSLEMSAAFGKADLSMQASIFTGFHWEEESGWFLLEW